MADAEADLSEEVFQNILNDSQDDIHRQYGFEKAYNPLFEDDTVILTQSGSTLTDAVHYDYQNQQSQSQNWTSSETPYFRSVFKHNAYIWQAIVIFIMTYELGF